MATIQTGIFTLYERFPNQTEALRSLCEKNETFKTLCEDHRKCCEAIRYWEGKEGDVAIQRRQEYETLMRDLEEEIWELLEENP